MPKKTRSAQGAFRKSGPDPEIVDFPFIHTSHPQHSPACLPWTVRLLGPRKSVAGQAQNTMPASKVTPAPGSDVAAASGDMVADRRSAPASLLRRKPSSLWSWRCRPTLSGTASSSPALVAMPANLERHCLKLAGAPVSDGDRARGPGRRPACRTCTRRARRGAPGQCTPRPAPERRRA